jgi:hypothetical protein
MLENGPHFVDLVFDFLEGAFQLIDSLLNFFVGVVVGRFNLLKL